MSTILKASMPAAEFALAETFEAVPEAEFDAVRLAAHGTERVVPLLWVTDVETDRIYEAMERDETTSRVRLVSERNHDSLFRMEWTARVRFLTHVLVEEDGAIVSAHGSDGEWTFRILFPERDAVSATYDSCEEYDVTIEQIYPLDDAPSLGGFQLTDEQFATVRTAVERGYYEVPRRTTLSELASEMDVSHQALSERLRRGHRSLIETVIAP